jgi:hypothetical protein
MLQLLNETATPQEFELIVEDIATALKEMRRMGIDTSNMGELLCWLGEDPEEVSEAAWDQTFELDAKYDYEVDHIVAILTNHIH